MATSHNIIPIFTKDYMPFIEGPEDHRHFITQQGGLYCVRESCEGCSYKDNGCEIEVEEPIQVYPLPNARRGIGYEERPFLVLKFQPGVNVEDLPDDILEGNFPQALEAGNNHFLLKDILKANLYFYQGQIRLYNYSPLQFDSSKYTEYFYLYQIYDPQHIYLSMDFSAVEPRIATLTSKCRSWMLAFQGTPKVIFREVEFKPELCTSEQALKQDYIYKAPKDGKLYCFAKGELDKLDYPKQCSKCPMKDACVTKREHKKNIANDWHGVNRRGLYGRSKLADIPLDEKGNYIPRNDDDKDLLKNLRDISKIVGLALCYGGSAWTVSKNMNETQEQAQEKINAFFSDLPDLQQYMNNAKEAAVRSGMVYNVFGRSRSVQADLDMGWKGRGYAERTALNHPIQSTAAEFMKIAMIRVGDQIIQHGWNPLWGLKPPATLEQGASYTDIKFSMISSVHDELLYLIMDSMIEAIVPHVHETMQCEDLMKSFNSGFSFEMDCELDTTRSWTATIKYDSAKIYLLRYLVGKDKQTSTDQKPTGYLISFESLTPEILKFIQSYTVQTRPDTGGQPLFKMAVMKGETAYHHHHQFDEEFFRTLQERYGVSSQPAVL